MDYICFLITRTGRQSDAGHMYPNQPLYRREDTGEEFPYLNCRGDSRAIGAMYYCDWLDEYGHKGPSDKPHDRSWVTPGLPRAYQPTDGKYLAVVTPGGTWIIDSRCSNCTLPNDNEHHCWVRHGTPPNVTVDKAGKTCQAGAGSIQCGKYHGFLRGGRLVEA